MIAQEQMEKGYPLRVPFFFCMTLITEWDTAYLRYKKAFCEKEDMMRMKRWLGLLVLFCLLLTGCSKIDSGMYKELADAVQATLTQSGGVMQLQSTAEGQDDVILKFTYRYDDADVMQYCVEQTDKTGRRLFLEHNDGSILQQWLLGHGSVSYDETSSDFIRYTRQSPYKYITLLDSLPQQKALTDLTCAESADGKQFTLTVDPQQVSGEKDAKEVLTGKTICYTISPDGVICGYQEQSVYTDENGNAKTYTVSLTLSDLGKVDEVKLPSIE